MKKLANRRSKNLIRVMAVLLTLLIALSVVFSLRGFLVRAYTPEDFAAAQETEALARQALDDAKAEADRLESFKDLLSDEALNNLLTVAIAEMHDVLYDELWPLSDQKVSQILTIYANDSLDDFDKYNSTSAIVNSWTAVVNLRVNDMMGITRAMFDNYSETFAESGIDYSLALDTLLWEIDQQRYVMIAAIFNYFDAISGFDESIYFKDPEPEPEYTEEPDENEIDTNEEPEPEPIEEVSDEPDYPSEQVVYDAIDKAMENIEYAINDLQNWVEYCIYVAVGYDKLDELEQEWRVAMDELILIKKEILGYDYSFEMSQDFYQIGSGDEIKVTINGDINAVDNLVYFDIYDPFWSNECNDFMLAGKSMSIDADFSVGEGEENNIILTVDSGYLDNLDGGAQLLSLYYFDDDALGWVDFYVEILAADAFFEPEEDDEEGFYDDTSASVDKSDTESKTSADTELKKDSVTENLPNSNLESESNVVVRPVSDLNREIANLPVMWIIIGGTLIVLIVSVCAILLICRKKIRTKNGVKNIA